MSVSLVRPFRQRIALRTAALAVLLTLAAAAPAFARVSQADQFPEQAATFGVESPAYVVIRTILFAALLLVIGAGAFRHVTLRIVRRRGSGAGLAVAGPAALRASGIAVAAGLALLVSVVARLVAQLYTTADLDGVTRELATTVLFQTAWGWGWFAQLAATLLAIASYVMIRRSGRGTAGAIVATLVLAVTPMLSGHAMAAEHFTGLTVAAGTVHVFGASGWLGTLTVLLLAGVPAAKQLPPAQRGPAVAEMVNAFSPVALICAGLVVASGTFVGWVHLGTTAALWRSEYGRLLLLKLGILGLVAGAGAFNWRVTVPALGNDVGTARLQRYATLELAAAVAIVIATAVLVATPLPSDLGMAMRM